MKNIDKKQSKYLYYMDLQNTATYVPAVSNYGYWQPGSTFSGLFGTLLSPLTSAFNSLVNFGFSQRQADLQNKLQLEWWNRQNEYNSPKSQIKRLVEAGLSPNLAYGQLQNSNAGDIGTARVGSQEFNVSPTLFSDAIKNSIELASMAESLRSQRLENKKKAAELLFGYPTDFTLGGHNYKINDYGDWLRFKNSLKVDSLFQRNVNIGLQNEFNLQSLDDRVKFERFRQGLAEKKMFHQSLLNAYQSEVNSWYTANQVFNMVNTGIGTLFNIIKPFIPGKVTRKLVNVQHLY